MEDDLVEAVEQMLEKLPDYVAVLVDDIHPIYIAGSSEHVSERLFDGVIHEGWKDIQLRNDGAIWVNGKEKFDAQEVAQGIARYCELSNNSWPDSAPARLADWIAQAAGCYSTLLRHFESKALSDGTILTLIPAKDREYDIRRRWNK